MTEILSFPKLGLDLTLNRVAFSVFGIDIYWYGLIMAAGFVLAVIYALRRADKFGVTKDDLIDVTIWSTIGSVICARLYYVIFAWDEFGGDIMKILDIRRGGIAIYGAVIGAFLTGFIVCKIKKLKFLAVADLASIGFLIGQAIGRWGNFVNIEAFGSNTNLPWGMTSYSISNYLASHQSKLAEIGVSVDPAMPVHPCFLYESIWCIIGFFLLNAYYKKRKFDGEIVLMYAAWYGFERMIVEGLRTDSLMLGKVRISQLLAALLFIAAAVTIIIIRNKIKKKNDPEFLKLYANSEDWQKKLQKISEQKNTKNLTDKIETAEENNNIGKDEQPVSEETEQAHSNDADNDKMNENDNK